MGKIFYSNISIYSWLRSRSTVIISPYLLPPRREMGEPLPNKLVKKYMTSTITSSICSQDINAYAFTSHA